MKNEKKRSLRRDPARALLSAVITFFFLAFFVLGLKDGNWQSFLLSVIVPAIVFAGTVGVNRLFPSDKLLFALTNFLCALGVLILYRLSPERGFSQAVNYGVGVGCMILCILLVRFIPNWKWPTMLMAGGGLLLLALPLVIGTEKNGARSWISLGGMNMQPSEIVKLALILCLSYMLSRRMLIRPMFFAALCVIALVFQNDLGTALLFFGVTMAIGFAATGSFLLVGAGVGGAALSLYLVNLVKPEMLERAMGRVNIWINPWSDADGLGYQIVQSLIAMVNGGAWGVGLGLGNASVIPEHHTDYIFSVILHEFGLIFGLIVLCMYAFIIIRGIMIARRSSTAFHALLATACSALIGLQTFVIIGGNIKLIPLTGVTLPFISHGGTSLVSSLCIIGLLQGVASRNADRVNADRALAMGGGELI